MHIAFLFGVTILPLSTKLLAEFLPYRTALLVYWSNTFLPGLTLYASWGCGTNSTLVRGDLPPEVSGAIWLRILMAQSLYAFGMLLSMFNTYWSIAFIVFFYAIAPKFSREANPPHSKLELQSPVQDLHGFRLAQHSFAHQQLY